MVRGHSTRASLVEAWLEAAPIIDRALDFAPEPKGQARTVITERLLRQYLVQRGHTRFAP